MQHAAFSPDGSKLIYSRGGEQLNIWRVPILSDRPATWSDAEQLTFDQAYLEYLDLSPDGQWLLFSSDRTGNHDLWKMPADGGEIQQMTSDPTPDWFPRWSPDGKHIAFYSNRSGNRDIWVMPADGGPARQLTDHEAVDWKPAWSPDAQMLAFSSGRSGRFDIWVVPAEGGEPKQLTDHPEDDSQIPEWSQDGEWVFFDPRRTGERRIWRVPVEGGEPESLTTGYGHFPRTSSDGRRIFFLARDNVWAVSLEDGTVDQMTDLEGRPGYRGACLATDGEYLYFNWGRTVEDLWVMDVAQE
jgi:TolB protein